MRPLFATILRGRWGRWFSREPAIPDPRLRAVTFPSADGVRLAGWYGELSRTAATIILCHGAPGDKRDMAGLAGALMDAGFDVLAFDFRGWGESGRTRVTLGHREVQDVLGAVEFVRTRRAGRRHPIGIVGLSMGAAAAIIAAAQTPAIDVVVADSSYARLDQSVERIARRVWSPFDLPAARRARRLGEHLIGAPLASVAPVEAVARISPRPVLIIHGRRDRLTDVADAHALYRACGDPKALWIVERAGHARTRRVGTREYDRRVIGFFNTYVAAMT
ncbi:MAG TPA: alpha/beta hydrolase [bacterium]|nr:alpha/beta hydrolase [bacterium]